MEAGGVVDESWGGSECGVGCRGLEERENVIG